MRKLHEEPCTASTHSVCCWVVSQPHNQTTTEPPLMAGGGNSSSYSHDQLQALGYTETVRSAAPSWRKLVTLQLERTLVKNDLLQKVIQRKYIDDERNQITRAIDIMQAELECCGGEGPLDYSTSVWQTSSNKDVEVPASCCKRYLQHKDRSRLCTMYVTDTDREKSEDTWQDGCKEKLQKFLDNYVIVIISIAAVYFLLQLICMIVTSIHIHLLNSLYVPQPDDIVYDMAHNQEKSPYPSRGDYRDYYH
ncbi:hypothetical protein RRG08_039120 [Elysia crispata]|uniref:Uncharacterized protein n=1 Tax=Elysia crispata TaxID=231223 RepID=A0AAE1A6U6_9GAST|nr:hypothetical protein RRG08_039120 [Elysia crispata]